MLKFEIEGGKLPSSSSSSSSDDGATINLFGGRN